MSTTYSKLALILVKDPITSSFIQQMAHEMGLLVRGVTTPEDAKIDGLRFRPDIVIIDLQPEPGPTGLDVVADLRMTQNRRIPAVIMTNHRSPYLVQDDPPSLRDCSYIIKTDVESPVALRAAIDRAIRGATTINHNNVMGLPVLTRNQAATLRLVANGLSNEQIAKIRNRSSRAIELTIARLYVALGVDRRSTVNSRVMAALMYHQSKVTVR